MIRDETHRYALTYHRKRRELRDFSSELTAIPGVGEKTAAKLKQRITEFQAFDSLADASSLPGIRCHELSADRKGQLAVDLVHPYRLIFLPNHDPLPTKADGGLDWKLVTGIVVVEVVDDH